MKFLMIRIFIFLSFLFSSYAHAKPMRSVNFDDYLEDHQTALLGTVLAQQKIKSFITQGRHESFSVPPRYYQAKVRVDRVLKGKFSYDEVIVKYVYTGHIGREFYKLEKVGDKVLLYPEQDSNVIVSKHLRSADMFEVVSKKFWLTKETSYEQGILRDMGFKYYSQELGMKRAREVISKDYNIKKLHFIDLALYSAKQFWVVSLKYRSEKGKEETLCFSFQKYDGLKSYCKDVPKRK